MIQYLKKEEKIKTRAMYETNFPEDSREFVDYYYQYKTGDNRIIVLEQGSEEESVTRHKAVSEQEMLHVMLHLNPYQFHICGKETEVSYIVAVATDASVRKQGKMAEVMKRALQDMAEAHQPFTFLIPANPKVYVSSGFVFVPTEDYAVERMQLEKLAEQSLRAAEVTERMILRETKDWDIPHMVKFSNALLSQKYNVFPIRTEAFYKRKSAELESENGALVKIQHKNEIVGMFSYGKEGKKAELQEILVAPDYQEDFPDFVTDYFPEGQIAITEMNYMVRILDLKTLVQLLRSEEAFSLKVQVQDTLIPGNAGCFEIYVGNNSSSMAEISQEETECTMDITELTTCLFEKLKILIREWV